MPVELAAADRALSGLADELERGSDRIAEQIARSVLEAAVRNAAGKPTPQSRMAASGFAVENGTITGSGSVSGSGGSADVEDVAGGSEYGSEIYPQFGPRAGGGLWMGPALTDEDEQQRIGEAELDRIIAASVG